MTTTIIPGGTRSTAYVCDKGGRQHVHVAVTCPFHSIKATYERDEEERGRYESFVLAARRMLEADHKEMHEEREEIA